MKIETIHDAKKILENQPIVAAYVHAFQFAMPAFLNKNLRILCYKETLDNKLLRKKCSITAIDYDLDDVITNVLLESASKHGIFPNIKNNRLYVRKPMKQIEDIAEKLHLKILGNPSALAKQFENKKSIRDILTHIGIAPIQGENIEYKVFQNTSYTQRAKKYSKKFVIQLPDINRGGGVGTFFVNNEEDFTKAQYEISSGQHKSRIIHSINITKFVDGISASIIGCATKYGTLTSTIQTQIIDIPEATNPKNGKGLFCGHDRSFKNYPVGVQKKADHIAQTLGKYMYDNGYRGIFGLDLLIDRESVHVVECNARYTGAFPMLSMIDYKAKKIPMEVFHMLECMNLDYTIDFEKINKSYKYKKQGSHIILSNRNNHNITCKKDIKAGVYRYKNNKAERIREGISYDDLKHKDEFILIDGNPRKGDIIKHYPHPSRFCHILRNKKIINKHNEITSATRKVIKYMYDTYVSQ